MKTTEPALPSYSCSDSFVMIKLNGFASEDKGHKTRLSWGLSPNGNEFL